MTDLPVLPHYSVGEEIANSVTHGAGSALHFFAVLFYVIPWPGAAAASGS